MSDIVTSAIEMLERLTQPDEKGAVFEDTIREKAGFHANVLRQLLARAEAAEARATSLEQRLRDAGVEDKQ